VPEENQEVSTEDMLKKVMYIYAPKEVKAFTLSLV
jgi:hypothetical protein